MASEDTGCHRSGQPQSIHVRTSIDCDMGLGQHGTISCMTMLPASATAPISSTPVVFRNAQHVVPGHGRFVVARVGEAAAPTQLLGTNKGQQLWTAKNAPIADVLAGAQALAARTGTAIAVILPKPGHAGLTFATPLFDVTDAANPKSITAIEALTGALTARSNHLLGIVDATHVFDAATLEVDPTLKAPRG